MYTLCIEHIYAHTHTHTHAHTHTRIHTHTHIHACTYMNMYTHTMGREPISSSASAPIRLKNVLTYRALISSESTPLCVHLHMLPAEREGGGGGRGGGKGRRKEDSVKTVTGV